MMDDFLRAAMSAFLVKAVLPLLVRVFVVPVFAVVLWIARNTLSPRWGEYLFGHHWYRRDQEALRQQAAQRAEGWLPDLGYWLGKQAGHLIRRK
jgi:hypothetical protein